uniref:Uncharacterized protein n=1 Tax=Octopus bimaculoides TaxID=37653 RepID=A0A0L8H0X6_OCTBM
MSYNSPKGIAGTHQHLNRETQHSTSFEYHKQHFSRWYKCMYFFNPYKAQISSV